ncbi:hypothetical protein E2C01_038514 [Portunus trituberculatus]|uniref:Uncharacterized protein n=1 Tax=Portunus trituberculatus TaxID=210409 RepID=A0A5B7FKB8_PORTR|nr:hypothetical protein [Portunus trituberculatus]
MKAVGGGGGGGGGGSWYILDWFTGLLVYRSASPHGPLLPEEASCKCLAPFREAVWLPDILIIKFSVARGKL